VKLRVVWCVGHTLFECVQASTASERAMTLLRSHTLPYCNTNETNYSIIAEQGVRMLLTKKIKLKRTKSSFTTG